MTTTTRPLVLTPQSAVTAWTTVFDTTKTPLDRLAASDSLRRLLRSFETTLVEEARAAGATWDTVAEALGITKQAAYQRFDAD